MEETKPKHTGELVFKFKGGEEVKMLDVYNYGSVDLQLKHKVQKIGTKVEIVEPPNKIILSDGKNEIEIYIKPIKQK